MDIPPSNTWSAFPGEDDLLIYPIVRKIDILSSNSYLIASDTSCVLIDPGGLAQQTDAILSAIREISSNNTLTGIFLTHAHIDHCHSLIHHPILSRYADIVYVHQLGAEGLRNEDYEMTQAALLGKDMKPVCIGHPLFSQGGRRGEYGLPEETVSLPEKLTIAAYHTPGHSPDSVCYQIGQCLFPGDTFFAAAPGVAGIVGYSRDDLISSLSGLITLIQNEQIAICFSGHGNPMTGTVAARSIQAILRQVEQLGNIATVTPAWAKETAGIAQDLMAEIDSTMTIISGRITFISHMLEELEESTAAGTLLSAIDSAAIDDLLAHYHVFAEEYRKGIHQDIQLALNAAAIAGKLERLVDRGTLDPFIEPFILEHLDELINDYMIIFRGYQPVSTRIPADPVLICRSIIDSLTASSSPPVFDLDSDEAFVNALARQMGRMEVVSEGTVWLRCKDGSSSASMDPLRFERAVRRLILEYAASGVEEIGIIIDRIDHDRVRITFRPDRIFPGSLAMRYFRHAFSFSGGTMLESGGDISIIYPPGEIII